MRKTMSLVLKIGGVAAAIAGTAYVVKWIIDEFSNNRDKETSTDEFSSNPVVDEEFDSKNHAGEDIDLNDVRSDTVNEIKIRHQEAARMMKEMLDEIENEPDESGEEETETENENRLDFDSMDASLDELFDEE